MSLDVRDGQYCVEDARFLRGSVFALSVLGSEHCILISLFHFGLLPFKVRKSV